MRHFRICVSGLLAFLLFAAIVHAAPPKEVAQPVPAAPSLGELRQQINAVMQERETALHDLNARYMQARLDDRVTLEAEGARLVEQYERTYLELLVQYHQQSGNQEELVRAQQMLERLNAGTPQGTPLNLDRNLQPETPPAASSKEGGVSNGQ